MKGKIWLIVLLLVVSVNAERLPQVDGDSDAWGDVLNSYLLREHGENGTHTNSTVTGTFNVTTDAGGLAFYSDSSGQIGIGTAIPQGPLHVNDSSSNTLAYFQSGDPTATIWLADNASSVAFQAINSGALAISVGGAPGGGSGATAAMRIESSGNIGIGTTSPDEFLHVFEGSAGSVTASGDTQLVVESSGDAGISILNPDASNGFLRFGSASDNAGGLIAWNHDVDLFSIGTQNTGAGIRFYTGDSSDVMRIDSSGNVGIGTTNPDSVLDIVAPTGIRDLIVFDTTDFDSSTSDAGINFSEAGFGRWQLYNNGDENDTFYIQTLPSGTVSGQFYQDGSVDLGAGSGSSKLHVNATSGNVGISTTSPSYELEIAGTIYATTYSNLPAFDSSAMWVNSSGDLILFDSNMKVGIGETSPTFKLEVEIGEDASDYIAIRDPDQWIALMGDSGSSSEHGYLALYDSGNLATALYANSTISYFGTGTHLGIGSTTPYNALHIGLDTKGLHIGSQDTGVDARPLQAFGDFDTNTTFYIRNTHDGARTDFFFYANNKSSSLKTMSMGFDPDLNALHFDNSQASDVMIIQNTGQVGIGTTEINSNALVEIDIGSANTDNLYLSSDVDWNPKLSFVVRDTITAGIEVDSGAVGIMSFMTGGSQKRMVIQNTSGNVGINTTVPQHTLQVQGTLNVSNAGSDGQLYLDGSGNLGVGTTTPDGTLHVHPGSAGSVTALSDADDLVIEHSASGGISILTPDSLGGLIRFGTPTDSAGASLNWNHDSDLLQIGTNNAGAELQFNIADGTNAMRIDSSGNVGIGTTSPAALFHVQANSSGVTANSEGDNLILEFTENGGISLLTDNTSSPAIFFGDTEDDDAAKIIYNHNGDDMRFRVNGSNQMVIIGNGNVGVGTTSPARKFTVSGGTIYGDASVNNTRVAYFLGSNTDTSLGVDIQAGTGSNDYMLRATDRAQSVTGLYVRGDGNVGIGTSSPESGITVTTALDGGGGTPTVEGVHLGTGLSGTSAQIQLYGTHATASGIIDFSDDSGEDYDFRIIQVGDTRLDFFSNPGHGFTLNDEGLIGVNDSSPEGMIEISSNGNEPHLVFDHPSEDGSPWVLTREGGVNNQHLRMRKGDGGTVYFELDDEGQALLGTLPAVGTDGMCWDGSGESQIGDCSSLRKYKEDIVDLSLGLETVLSMQPKEFTWVERMGGERDIGFVAEEVEEVNPLIAEYVGNKNDELSGVKYRQYTAVLTNAIKEQQGMIDQLEARIAALEGS